MKAITLQQPTPWAVCYAGQRVLNMPRPAGLSRCKRGDGPYCIALECSACKGAGCEPLRVAVHAGATIDQHYFDLRGAMRFLRPVRHVEFPGVQFMFDPGDYEPSRKGSWPYITAHDEDRRVTQVEFSAVVAVVTITGSHPSEDCIVECDGGCFGGDIWHDSANCSPCPKCNGTGIGALCSPWAHPPWDTIGQPRDTADHHWTVGEVSVLPTPVPCRGRSGLWSMPEQVADAVEAQL